MEPREQLWARIAAWRTSLGAIALSVAPIDERPAPRFLPEGSDALLGELAGLLPEEEFAAAFAHLARSYREQALCTFRLDCERRGWRLLRHKDDEQPAAVAQARVLQGAPHAERWFALLRGHFPQNAFRSATEQAQERIRGLFGAFPDAPRHVDAGPSSEERAQGRDAFWSANRELLEVLRPGSGVGRFGLDWDEGRGLFEAKGRWRRVAALAPGIGAQEVLRQHCRVGEPHRGQRFGTLHRSLVVEAAPGQLTFLPSPIELGAVSELAAAEAIGRGAMMAMASPALPTPLAWSPVASVPRSVGMLWAQVVADPGVLRRGGGSRRERDVAKRKLGTFLGRQVMLDAAALDGQEACEKVLGGDWSPGLVGMPWRSIAAGVRWRATLGSLALWPVLREAFDEDWYRNPRCAEVFRSAGERGATLSVEAWLAEFGVSAEDAVSLAGARLREIIVD